MKRLSAKLIGAALLLFAPLFLLVGVASAQSVRTGTNSTINNNQTVNSTVFMAGSNVDVAGRVNGDVFCAGQTVTISGTVTGDVICAGQTVTITGKVGGNVRLAGQTVTIDGTIDHNATIMAQNFNLGGKGRVNDLMGAANTASISGSVGRDFGLASQTVQISGNVVRDINGSVELLTLTNTAKVGGNITVTSPNDPTINKGASVSGTVTRNQPKEQSQSQKMAILPFATFLWFLYIFAALIVTSIGLVLIAPSTFVSASSRAKKGMGKTALTGLIAGIAVPTVIFVFIITLIGIPLGLFIGLVWLLVMFLSGPFAAFLLGRYIYKTSNNSVITMLAGGSLLLALYFVPILGFFAVIAAHLFGTGMVIQEIQSRLPKPQYKLPAK